MSRIKIVQGNVARNGASASPSSTSVATNRGRFNGPNSGDLCSFPAHWIPNEPGMPPFSGTTAGGTESRSASPYGKRQHSLAGYKLTLQLVHLCPLHAAIRAAQGAGHQSTPDQMYRPFLDRSEWAVRQPHVGSEERILPAERSPQPLTLCGDGCWRIPCSCVLPCARRGSHLPSSAVGLNQIAS